jgi:hypothetical protein
MRGDLEAVASLLESRLNPPANLFTSSLFWAAPSAPVAIPPSALGHSESPAIRSPEPEPAAKQQGSDPVAATRSPSALRERTPKPRRPTRSDGVVVEAPPPATGGSAIFVTAKALARIARNGAGADLVSQGREHACVFIVGGPTLEVVDLTAPLLSHQVAGGVVVRDNQIVACGDIGWLGQNWSAIRSFLARDSALHDGDEADDADSDEDDSELGD